MAVDGLQCDGQAAETFLTYEAQFVMHCLQVINNCALVLTHFPTPGAVGLPLKWHSASGSCMPVNPITLGDSDGDTTLKNFSPFGKVISE